MFKLGFFLLATALGIFAAFPRVIDGPPPADFTGLVIQRYPNGQVQTLSTYRRGELEGPSTEYGFDFKLKAISNYHHGVKDGRQRSWFMDGQPRSLETFRDGIKNGEMIQWFENGAVFKRIMFKDGLETERKILYAEGDIYSNYVRKNGRTYGLDGGALCMEKKAEGEK